MPRDAAHTHLAAGRPARALQILTERLAHHADDPAAWDAVAEALLRLGHAADACDAAKQAWLRAKTPETAALLAVCLAQAGRTDEALSLIDAILREPPPQARSWERIARTFEALGQAAAGIEAREQAARLAPADAGVALRLAERLEKADRRSEARAVADSLGPVADRLRVRLDHHDGRLDEAAERANALLDDPSTAPDVRQGLWMELARIEARRGRPSEAFTAASRGNTAALEAWSETGGNIDQLPSMLDRLLATVLPPLPPAEPSPGMAFVVGFPRSGTTLVQQILQSHPGAQTLDELPLIDTALAGAMPGRDLASVLAQLGEGDAAAVRDAWWRQVRSRTTRDGRLVIDKLPLNLLRVDLLARVFPGAPIVTVIRDPRDAVLSAFLQDFELNHAMAQCADLVRCAQLYARAFDLWFRARSQLPRAIELRYEELVRDPRRTLLPVLSVLGLPWDDRVLAHTGSAKGASIATPSYRDVRRPLYTGQIGRWRAFAHELAPVLPILAPYAEALGY